MYSMPVLQMYGPGDEHKPRGVRRFPGQTDVYMGCPTRPQELPPTFELGAIVTDRPHGVRRLPPHGQIDYSPVTNKDKGGRDDSAVQAPDHPFGHNGIRRVVQPQPNTALAPIPGFRGIGVMEPFDSERQPPAKKKEQGLRHFLDHDPLHLQPNPTDENELRRRNCERHPEFWKVNPTRALIVGDMELANKAIARDPEFIPHMVRGECSPSKFHKETAIAGLGGMGRDLGVAPVRRRVILNPDVMYPPAPHHTTLLQQARVWSHCV